MNTIPTTGCYGNNKKNKNDNNNNNNNNISTITSALPWSKEGENGKEERRGLRRKAAAGERGKERGGGSVEDKEEVKD